MQLSIYSASGNIIALIWQDPSLLNIDNIILNHPTIDQILCQYLNTTYIFNRDGSEAKQCGNGLRALAFHIGGNFTRIKLKQSSHQVKKINGNFWVNLGIPIQRPHLALHKEHAVIDTGNLHLIIEGNICHSIINQYKHTYNISFVNIYDGLLNIQTYERGVGWTKACGSAAAAASYMGYLKTNNKEWEAAVSGGKLSMRIIRHCVWQTGEIKKIKNYALL